MHQKTKLKSGLRVITVPIKGTRVATILVLVRAGSKYERKEISGISHFLEHMFFKKTKKRPSPLKIAEDLDKVGGLYNAFTSEDYTGYYAKVDISKLSLAVDWVSDIYLNSLLPEKEVEKEKGVIKEEINMRYDNPMARCQILFESLLYGDQPAGWDIAGTKESVSNITRKNLLSYMKSRYIAENTVVVVAGNIDEKSVKKEVSKMFSGIKSGKPKKNVSVKEEQQKPGILTDYKKTDQTHLCLGVRGYNLFHSMRHTQKIIATILGGMMSSRLFIKIRDEMGLAYYISTDVESNPDTGFLVTRAGVDNKRVNEAVSAIVGEYSKIKKEPLSDEELKKAKEHLKGERSILLESSDALAHFFGTQELLREEISSLKETFKLIDKITVRDVQSVAEDIFRPEKINLSLVGPSKKGKGFEKLLLPC